MDYNPFNESQVKSNGEKSIILVTQLILLHLLNFIGLSESTILYSMFNLLV